MNGYTHRCLLLAAALALNAQSTKLEFEVAAVQALGMRLFAPEAPAAAVTAVLPPEGVDSGAIVKGLRSKFAIIVTDGQGEMKGSLFRIAHIGFFDYMDTIAVIGALEQVAVALNLPLPNLAFGTGVIAAQKVFVERTK